MEQGMTIRAEQQRGVLSGVLKDALERAEETRQSLLNTLGTLSGEANTDENRRSPTCALDAAEILLEKLEELQGLAGAICSLL